MASTFPIRLAGIAAVTVLLAACGGGDDSAAGASSAALTLSATTPAAMATTIDLASATTKGNNARPADSFSSVPYCEAFWENASGANGKRYSVQVYFKQSDKAVMHVSVLGISDGWSIFNNNSGAAITGVTVDTAAKTVAFNNKVLAGGSTETGTLAGTVGFQPNAAAPICGA